VLRRFRREGRGEGIYEGFGPWHQVSRGDPASSGRSHLLDWKNRLRNLLSDREHEGQLFATMPPDLDDSLEQFKLSLGDCTHPLAAYGDFHDTSLYPGTKRLAKELGIKHPLVRGDGETEDWVPSTDIFLVFKPSNGPRAGLAVAIKPGFRMKGRTKELLRLEREVWVRRRIPWLLITPEQYEESVGLTLRRVAPWALAEPVSVETRQTAARIVRELPWHSFTSLIVHVGTELGDFERAKCAVWQSVWCGELPIDLRRGWRPHLPFTHVSPETFWAFNPIASRRSAWCD